MAWPIRAALLANSDWFTLFAEALGRGGKGPEAKPPFVDVAPPLGKDRRRRSTRERGGRESREFWSREAKEGRVRPTGRSREDEEEREEAHSPHCPASPRAQEGRSFDLSPSLAPPTKSPPDFVSSPPSLLCHLLGSGTRISVEGKGRSGRCSSATSRALLDDACTTSERGL